jgi:hypothetical protein
MLVWKALGPNGAAYMRECLEGGRSLSRMLLAHDLTSGTILARVPAHADEPALSEFALGNLFIDAQDERQSTTDLVRSILEYLSSAANRICVLECYPHSPEDSGLQEHDSNWNSSGDEVYVLLDRAHTPSEVEQSIYFAQTWAFLACFSSIPDGVAKPDPFQEIPSELMEAIAARAEGIVVGAYDASGFLYWTRNGAAMPLPGH